MNNIESAGGLSRLRLSKRILAPLLCVAVIWATTPGYPPAAQDAPPTPPPPAASTASAPAYTQQTPEQLQQLVAPIALYPDALVAQILAGSTFPEQIVLADRWVQAHPDLKGDALSQAVDQQPWDPSVKALAAFPSVLGNMDKNLGWTSTLGDAYYNQQQDVMQEIQLMRQRAQAAGNLKTTPQQTVSTQDSNIEIEPATPDEVYVPAYDPWLVYGDLVPAWPYWYAYPGIWFDGPYLSWGVPFGLAFVGGFGWGWGHWGFDWHNHYPLYGGRAYVSHSPTFYNRGAYYRGGGERGVVNNVARGSADAARGGFGDRGAGRGAPGQRAEGGADRRGAAADPFGGRDAAARGYAEPRGESGVRSGAFSGYDHGGMTRGFSQRGSASFGGGGGEHGGGGGGGHGGGGGRR
jgi:uncharacterized membrane protein YgcG